MQNGQHGHQAGQQANTVPHNSSGPTRHAGQEGVDATYRRPWSYPRPLHTTFAVSAMRSSLSLEEPPAPPSRPFTEAMFNPIFDGGAVRPADFLCRAPIAPPALRWQGGAPAPTSPSSDSSSSSSAQATSRGGGHRPSSSPLTPLSSTPRPRPTRGRGQAATTRGRGRGRGQGGKRGSTPARAAQPTSTPIARSPLRSMVELDNTRDDSPGVARAPPPRISLDEHLDFPTPDAQTPAAELARSIAGPSRTSCPAAAFNTPNQGLALLIAAFQASSTPPAQPAGAGPIIADLFNSSPPPIQAPRPASPEEDRSATPSHERAVDIPPLLIDASQSSSSLPAQVAAAAPTLADLFSSPPLPIQAPRPASPQENRPATPPDAGAVGVPPQPMNALQSSSTLPTQPAAAAPTVADLLGSPPPPIQAPRPASPEKDWSATPSDERAAAISSSSSWADDEPQRTTKKAGKQRRSTKATKTKPRIRTRSATPIWEQGRPETRSRRTGEVSSSVPMHAREPVPKSKYRGARSRPNTIAERKTEPAPKPEIQAKRSRSVIDELDESVVEPAAPPAPSESRPKRPRTGHEDPVVDARPPLRRTWDIDDFGSDTDTSEPDALREAIEQQILATDGGRPTATVHDGSKSDVEYESPVVDDRPPLRQVWVLADLGIEITAPPPCDDQLAAAHRDLSSATHERPSEDAAASLPISNSVSDTPLRSS